MRHCIGRMSSCQLITGPENFETNKIFRKPKYLRFRKYSENKKATIAEIAAVHNSAPKNIATQTVILAINPLKNRKAYNLPTSLQPSRIDHTGTRQIEMPSTKHRTNHGIIQFIPICGEVEKKKNRRYQHQKSLEQLQ